MNRFRWLTERLRGLGFRAGCMVGAACVAFYIISFAQMALPISVGAKGALWVAFFGLAKAAQYTAILILGKAGVERLKSAWLRRKSAEGGARNE